MNKVLRTMVVVGGVVSALSLSGCATVESVDKAMAAAQNAQSTADRAVSDAQAANAAAQRAQSTADQAVSATQSVNEKVDTFIREECSENKREAQHHSACPQDTRGVKG